MKVHAPINQVFCANGTLVFLGDGSAPKQVAGVDGKEVKCEK